MKLSKSKRWNASDEHTPRRRHCLINPPDDMFFSASISLKLSELANTRTSTMAMRRDRKVTAVSEDMPCVASMFSNSVWERREKHTHARRLFSGNLMETQRTGCVLTGFQKGSEVHFFSFSLSNRNN